MARHPIQRRHLGIPCPDPDASVPFLVSDRLHGERILHLHPGRVRAIHFLFAGKGDQAISKFGHVALRLVLAPEEKPPATPAARNLTEHLVLGFMAHIDTFGLDPLVALKGGYTARLVAIPFMDAYRNYTITEFRELHSLPLDLTAPQREQVVRELSEIQWRKAVPYDFFTRNCATLLQETLSVVLPGYADTPELNRVRLRPDRLFAAIRNTDLIAPRETSPRDAEANGFLFPSTRPYYEKGLPGCRFPPTPTACTTSIITWRVPRKAVSRPLSRTRGFFHRLLSDPHLLEAQLLIEELALMKSERRFLAESGRYFKNLDPVALAKNLENQLAPDDFKLLDTHFLTPVSQRASEAAPIRCHSTGARNRVGGNATPPSPSARNPRPAHPSSCPHPSGSIKRLEPGGRGRPHHRGHHENPSSSERIAT